MERAVYRAADGPDPIDNVQFDPFESPYRGADLYSEAEPAAADNEIVTELPPPPPLPGDFRVVTAQFACDLLKRALESNRFNQRATADALGLSYHQLRYELKKHRLNRAGPGA